MSDDTLPTTLKRSLPLDATAAATEERPKKKARRDISFGKRLRLFIMPGGHDDAHVYGWRPLSCADETVRANVDDELRTGNETVANLMLEVGEAGDEPVVPTEDDVKRLPESLRHVPVEQWGDLVEDDDGDVVVLCMGQSLR